MLTKFPIFKGMVFLVVMYGWKSGTIKRTERQRIFFQIVVLKKTLENPLDFREIKPVNLKVYQS